MIDSGIAYDHAAFAGRYVGGWDFAENDSDPYDDPGPASSHGTHVAGVLAGSSPLVTGVAPGADLIGLRVFSDDGRVYFTWVEQALRWVHNNLRTFENPITTVNLSLGIQYNGASPPSWASLEDEFAQLKAAGVFITASAGNDFELFEVPGLNYPSSSPLVTPVMSWEGTGLGPYSQRSTRAIAAPGASILGPVPDAAGNGDGIANDYGRKSGTSIAAPYVAGASMLIRQALSNGDVLAVDPLQIDQALRQSSTPFYDPESNATYNRIDLPAALSLVAPVLPGDLNRDGAVDAADYTVWRDNLGTTFDASTYSVWRASFGSSTARDLPGDFNADGLVDAADYTVWRDNLGLIGANRIDAAGDGDGAVGAGDLAVWRAAMQAARNITWAVVPEPAGGLLLGLCLCSLAAATRLGSK